MKNSVRFLLCISILLQYRCTTPHNINNLYGVMDFNDSKIFINLTNFRVTADDEVYAPTLFTVQLPIGVQGVWHNLSQRPQYVFLLDEEGIMYVYDIIRPQSRLLDSLILSIDNRRCTLITSDSAASIVHTLEEFDLNRDLWLKQHNVKLPFPQETQSYIARQKEMIFIFFNTNYDKAQNIVDSYNEIRPHSFSRIMDD